MTVGEMQAAGRRIWLCAALLLSLATAARAEGRFAPQWVAFFYRLENATGG